ncbi:MAG TPA: DUF1684 domain-containing protein [Patescibacteria group bacterium]|nr:DUF1684 domain-containing protein [Patescibacteria group bacterium]
MQPISATARSLGMILSLVLVCSCSGRDQEPGGFAELEKEELKWRQEREWSMTSPTSWFTIAGLFWLEEGDNTFGTGPERDIILPEGSAPPVAGTFVLREGAVRVIPAEGVEITMGGNAIGDTVLHSDDRDQASVIALNDLRMWVIKRGDRYAIRLRDFNAPRFKNFKGLKFFPVKEEYRIRGDYNRFPRPKMVMVPTVVGTEAAMVSPGYVIFRLGEGNIWLDAFEAGLDSTKLFIIFKDGTSGTETYGACRFLVADILDDGSVDLNFNRAHNPPCAYTPFATCPLPPRRNELSVRIEAGEMVYEESH